MQANSAPSRAVRDSPGLESYHGLNRRLSLAETNVTGYELWEEQVTSLSEGTAFERIRNGSIQ